MTEGRLHEGAPVLTAGVPLAEAELAIILVHGRGSTADSIIRLSNALNPDEARKIAWFAPQATGNSWYPYRFLEPVASNQPWLDSALGVIDELVEQAVGAGLEPGRVLVGGFSQGACLSLEYASRRTTAIGGVIGLSGGLIGPLAEHPTIPDLTGLDVFLGCGDIDEHVPIKIAEESAAMLKAAGATVDFRRYPNFPHTINEDEVRAVRELIGRVASTS